MQNQQEQELQNTNQNQQNEQMQLLLQRHAWRQQQQQQFLRGFHLISGSARCPISNDPLMRQNLATSNAMATKTYEDRLKLPLQKDALDDANIQVSSLSGIITWPCCFYMIRITCLYCLLYYAAKSS